VHRHQYRGRRWYIVQNELLGRHHRFSDDAYQVIGLMDGQRTVEQIWELAAARLGDEVPTQDETIRLLGQLHGADLIQSDVSPDVLELFKRHRRRRRADRRRRSGNPLSMRFPLFDPEKLLQRGLPLVRPLFSRWMLLIWCVTVVSAGVLALMHWRELSNSLDGQVFTLQNLLLLWITYPLVKVLHELGHAFATKVWGGEVHEMGITLLVLMPLPYVDAAASSSFPEKHRRMLVGAMGVMVELLVASLALFVWLNVEPGLVKTFAYNLMLIGGVSTLFFNGNPLLRFDAYYVLADAIEIPNLAGRSSAFYGNLVQRYLFGVRDVRSLSLLPGERAWLLFYGAAAFVYRYFILFAIIFFVGSQYFFIGVLIALWAAFSSLLMPLIKYLNFLLNSQRLAKTRVRSVTVASTLAGTLAAFLFFVPVPLRTTVEGVIWLPEHARVRAGTDCFVQRLIAREGSWVEKGQPLIECQAPFLQARLKVLQARRQEIEARLKAESREERVKAQILRDEIDMVEAELASAQEQAAKLVIRSGSEGRFVLPRASDMPRRFVSQGNEVGYVLELSDPLVRVVVPQEQVGLVRAGVEGVQVKLSERPEQTLNARVLREVPAATDELPSAALGTGGGGWIAVDPADPSGLKPLESVFQFDLNLLDAGELQHAGGRAYVRFDHGAEPLIHRWYRDLRRLFLRQFDA
jgi:putative peptide zinc metalloprotease protein